jgi:hypothetical protein
VKRSNVFDRWMCKGMSDGYPHSKGDRDRRETGRKGEREEGTKGTKRRKGKMEKGRKGERDKREKGTKGRKGQRHKRANGTKGRKGQQGERDKREKGRKGEKRDRDTREKGRQGRGEGVSPHLEAFAPTMLICQQMQLGRRAPGGRPTPFRLYKFNSPNGVRFPVVTSWCVSEHLRIPNWEL